MRKRLDAIKLLWSEKSQKGVISELGCSRDAFRKWINIYNNKGLERLVQPIKRKQTQRLASEQKAALKKNYFNEASK